MHYVYQLWDLFSMFNEIGIASMNLVLWNIILTIIEYYFGLDKLCLENFVGIMFWIVIGDLHE